jgi:DNA-binding transcriptional MerR regulator
MATKTLTSLRLKAVEAAELLNVSLTTLWTWSKEDLFTMQFPNGRGVGKRCYYLRDEIELYARTGKRELVAAYRVKHKRS